jgi:hypothetical protein
VDRHDHAHDVSSNPNSFPDFSKKDQHPFILLRGTLYRVLFDILGIPVLTLNRIR